MERYKRKFEEATAITQEMIDWFYKRTQRHIDLVCKYGYKINEIMTSKDEVWRNTFKANLQNHDAFKFKEPEFSSYILITWNYKCKDEGIILDLNWEDTENMNRATTHHVKNSEHHPEFWSSREDVIPKNDRDKFDPDSVPTIEIKNMPFMFLCEMVADWCAMSEERGNTPKEWAEKVIGKRWSFPDKQVKQIYKLIEEIWY